MPRDTSLRRICHRRKTGPGTHKKNKFGWAPLLIAEGYRFGNFKPSPPTVAVLRRLMSAAGVPAAAGPAAAATRHQCPAFEEICNSSLLFSSGVDEHLNDVGSLVS